MQSVHDISQLEQTIGYSFRNHQLMVTALSHSSYVNEKRIRRYEDNERLEFLGDAILEMISSEFLYTSYPDMDEGELTKLRASLVCEPALAHCAREISLEEYLLLGKGEEATGGRKRDSIISDALEALIGAIYLDGGFTSAKEFILKCVLSDVENQKFFYDSKTILQEMIQKDSEQLLHYEILDEKGPDHNKVFTAAAIVGERILGKGEGRTKKAAEQKAAYASIMALKQEQ